MSSRLFLLLFTFSGLAEAAPFQFRDATTESGIKFVHTDGSSGRRYIVETIASGLALIDFNGDGLLDIYFLNGAPLPGTPQPARPPANALYRNNGDGTFTDFTERSGAGLTDYSVGVAVADYNNDGHEDLFVTNYGPPRLLRNNGDGTFTDVTREAGLGNASEADWVGAGAVFLDYDLDGHLDLYIGNYLKFDPATVEPCARANVPVYCDPRTYPPLPDRLYRNNGDGTFKDMSESSGIGRYKSYSMGIVASDFNGDGRPDIFVGNDIHENYLFLNRGDGTFEQASLLAGVAYDLYGDEQGTMGVNVGDFDGDGWFDIVVTTYQNQVNTLYKNLGVLHKTLQFQDVSLETGVGAGSLPLVTWGCGLVDFNNDGRRELFIAAGHLQDSVERYNSSIRYKQRKQLFQWRAGRFRDVTALSGPAFEVIESSRGAVFGDLNNDGKVDIVVLNARGRPTLMINESTSTGHWVLLKLTGTRGNRSAVGARVRITAGGVTQVDEVRAGRGYQSAEDLRLHFGLNQPLIERLEVRWPGGAVEAWTNVRAGRVVHLKEGATAAPGR